MSALASASISLEKLEEIVSILKKKNEKWFHVTIDIQTNSKSHKLSNGNTIYQNVSMYASQSKEEREANKKRYYIGNGGVFWTDGVIKKAGESVQQAANNQQAPQQAPPSADDLPF